MRAAPGRDLGWAGRMTAGTWERFPGWIVLV